jgi:CheY-like chemotaxis protein
MEPKPRRILYAEDEYANRKLLQFQLNRQGVHCDTAADGVEAVAMFRERPYSLVILDQYMPGMNGNEVAGILRAIKPDIPLIAITSDDSQVPLLKQSGFNRIFLKPLRGDDYIAAIIGYL